MKMSQNNFKLKKSFVIWGFCHVKNIHDVTSLSFCISKNVLQRDSRAYVICMVRLSCKMIKDYLGCFHSNQHIMKPSMLSSGWWGNFFNPEDVSWMIFDMIKVFFNSFLCHVY